MNKIKIKFIGDLQKLPKKLKDNIAVIESQTKKNKKLNLFIALNYGGKQDIKQAIQKLVKENKKNDKFENYLYSKSLPEVDLLIRTGGYKRLTYLNIITLKESDISRIIEMAWEDRTPFDAIESTYGLNQNQVEDLMRDNLKKRIYTALIIYPLLVLITIYSNEMVIRLTLNIIIFLSAFELSKMCFYSSLSHT